MDDSAVCFEYYGGLATKINGEVIPVPTNAMVMAVKEPMGVAGQIIPWNYPLAMAAWKLGPALAAGCTRGDQARRADAAHAARAGEGLRGLRPAAGRGQHRHRHGPGVRRPDRGPPRCPEDRLHRLGRGGQAHHAERRRSAQAGVAGAGRQVAQHLLRRRRLRGRGGRRALRRVHQPGRGLLGRQPGAGAAGHLQEVRGCLRREGQDHQARARHRAGDQDGPAGERRAARPGAELPGDRQEGGEGGGRRRGAQAVRARAGTSSRRSSTTSTTAPGSRRKRSSAR